MERQKVLERVKKAVHEVDDQAEIILFGSRARGDFNKESDWDFLVLTEKEESFKLKEQIWDKLFYAELETDEVFSSIIHSKRNWEYYQVTSLYKFISNEGILV
ncbi:MAG: nucleotidyltransferase domain-containing protein [Bacteroidetes bacterium]|nr:nucleotidyltransferase domain-containing protein [Bacteroidota bacterium]